MTTTQAKRLPTYEDALALALDRCEFHGEKQVIRIFNDTPRNRAMGRYLVRPYDGLGEKRTRVYRTLLDQGWDKQAAGAISMRAR